MSKSVDALIEEFSKLPGIGGKTAQRLTYHILKSEPDKVSRLADALLRVKQEVRHCSVCGNLCEGDTGVCEVCSNDRRDKHTICIVQETVDIAAIERLKEYKGVYHVLHGAISPMDGVTPSDLNIQSLLNRLHDEDIQEIILATNPNISGETTAVYLSKLLKPLGLKVTRLAYGLPMGGTLDFSDEISLGKSFSGRTEI